MYVHYWNSTPLQPVQNTHCFSRFTHLLLPYSYRPRRSFLSCLRRVRARSRLGPWCAKPCQVSACLPLSVSSLASSSWRDATFTMGTVVGRP
uniref:Uncharacterized protein n=1 Tax=Arundo donax TaxID=35708 RepID=A0A0A9DC65_ARUDO